jgi:plasmid stability protein
MSAITIRKLPEGAKQRLRMRAAAHGRSMEAEARIILLEALDRTQRVDLNWIEQLIEIGDELGGVELELPADEPASAAEFTDS